MIDALAWEVMNTTADDWESLDQLHSAVCKYLAPTSRTIVAETVVRLVNEKLMEEASHSVIDPVAVVAEPTEYWFRMTPQGRDVWKQLANQYCPEV